MDYKTQQAFLQTAQSAIAQAMAMNSTAAIVEGAAVVVPKMLPFDFSGAPTFDAAGVCTADWWMVGKTGCQKGALYAHWQNYNMTVTLMGAATEYDVVCAPNPADPVQMSPSNYNACVRHAWEPAVGWVTNPPPGLESGAVVTDEIRAGWAAWDKAFKASHGIK